MPRINAVVLLVCSCLHASPPAKAATLDNASQAAFKGDYASARALYTELARTTTEPKNKEDVEIALANIEWRIDGAADAARIRLAALGTFRALLEQSRLERDAARYPEAVALARKALPLAQNKRERSSAELSLAAAIVESNREVRLSHVAPPASDLREAFGILGRLVEDARGRLQPSLLYLDAALMLGDGDAALDAWKSYFDGTAQSSTLAPTAAALERLLPNWRGGASPEIAASLAASRLFDEAVLVGAGPDIVAWAAYLRRARDLTHAFYRDVANRRGRASDYRRELTNLTLEVCTEIKLACSEKTLEGEPGTALFAQFGALIDLSDKGGTFNLHFGHAVADEKRLVTQYGHSGTVRFIVLDAMVSNGFDSWSWDGKGQHGGWADGGLIVQVRPAYAQAPVDEWERLVDEAEIQKRNEEIARETEKDWGRASANPTSFLPGLQLRMRRDAENRILDELRARGLSGPALRDAFILELGRRVIESSIFAHEGRHAIDAKASPKWWRWLVNPGWKSEFQAKLSEVAFASDPRLALTAGIIVNNIGTESPHGEANTRIMKGMVQWMKEHQAEIADLDPKRPLLPQLDKLTDDQLRAVARGMDPMAN